MNPVSYSGTQQLDEAPLITCPGTQDRYAASHYVSERSLYPESHFPKAYYAVLPSMVLIVPEVRFSDATVAQRYIFLISPSVFTTPSLSFFGERTSTFSPQLRTHRLTSFRSERRIAKMIPPSRSSRIFWE